jgi:CMP-N-acetylneuraminic acid synthetase
MERIVAIMPIKLNNERLPGKNTMLLAGKPLLQHELDYLLQIPHIDEIYVYCSDESIVPFLPQGVSFLERPTELDLPTSNFTQIFNTFSNKIDADIYVYAHATAPFLNADSIKKCIDAVCSGDYDSAFCATKIQDFLWKNGEPLNFDASNIPRSQDIEPIYRETSGVYVFRKQVFEQYKRRIGEKPYVHEVSYKEALDINTKDDFELAKVLCEHVL